MEKNRRYLDRRLDERNRNPDSGKKLDRSLWDELGCDLAVMVSDMSGFTRITKKLGILHFLALHRRGVEIASPEISKHGGMFVKDEADNMICTFTDTAAALRGSADVLGALAEYNEKKDEDSRVHFCIGVSWGKILRLQDDVFGDPVNVAYKLGEDVAGVGDILLSEVARATLPKDFNEFKIAEPESVHSGNVDLRFCRVTT